MPRTRTRGAKAIIDQLTTADNSICLPCIKDTTGESIIEPDDNSTAVSSQTDDHSTISLSKKPPASRVIVEVNPVTKILKEHLQCPKCNHKLEVSFPPICFASSVRLQCKNTSSCTYVALSKPQTANNVMDLLEDSASRTRNTDYSLNILFILSHIASGDGGTEAARLCGLIGLSNSTTMRS